MSSSKSHPDTVRLCAEMLVHATFSPQTSKMTTAEIRQALAVFFDADTISAALSRIKGATDKQEKNQ